MYASILRAWFNGDSLRPLLKDFMENENFDLDQKPAAANKDLWLFLIIIDIVCLCVFGFFLYKNLSARFFSPAEGALAALPAQEELAEADAQKDLSLEEEVVSAVKEQEAPVNNPAKEPAEEDPVVKEAPAVAPAPAKEQKVSVIVKENPKSDKYRRVTFRYYGEGKKVSIVSGFTMAKPQALRKKKDYWETTLSIAPGRYRFLYIVDGVNTPDPYSPEEDGRSVVVVE